MDTYARKEIRNQPSSWQQTLENINLQDVAQWTWSKEGQYLFVGCGTSFHLAYAASRQFQLLTGLRAIAMPGSDATWLASEMITHERPLTVFLISRSGQTTEILWAMESLQRSYPPVQFVGVTCDASSELARRCERSIVLPHAMEQSVVMTQSFTNMLLALQLVAAAIASSSDVERELQMLPGLAHRHWAQFEDCATAIAQAIHVDSHVFYFGTGSYLGLASEATLKLKEMTQIRCEAYNPFEFRHGPLSLVDPPTQIISFERQTDYQRLDDLYAELRKLGASVTAISERCDIKNASSLSLPESLSDVARSLLYMPVAQMVAHGVAERNGLHPDRPRHLSQVVQLDD